MKNPLVYFVIFSLVGILSGCTGGSPPGLHKTRERPSSAIEPAIEKKEDSKGPIQPAASSRKTDLNQPKAQEKKTDTPPVETK